MPHLMHYCGKYLQNPLIYGLDITMHGIPRPFYSISTGQEMSFNNWNIEEPSNGNSKEHCTHIYEYANYKWNDKECDHPLTGYICEQHHLTTTFIKNNTENRQTANILNSIISSDYQTIFTEMEEILADTRTSTDNVLVQLKYTTHELIVKSKTSIDEIVRSKPYLLPVIADVGETIVEVIRETLKEISEVSIEVQQTIADMHLNAEESVREISSDFEEKLENNSNAIDKLFD